VDVTLRSGFTGCLLLVIITLSGRRLCRALARRRDVLALAVCALFITGCSTVGYYSQAVGGHLKLMSARQSIAEILADDATDPELRKKLQTLVEARVFATEQLYLPDNDSYSTYVETGKSAVTWNVVATDEFSMQAKTWCFPVAGCVSYRGYFDRDDAQAYADGLTEQSLDVSIGGASAYSTLGWFEDPVLDTMLRGGDVRYVGTLFHELAHQVLYVKDDSDFNEAYASFVEQLGTRLWLDQRDEQSRIEGYDASLQRAEGFIGLLGQTRESLVDLYRQDMDAEDKRQRKQAVFDEMRSNYEVLKEQWQGFAGYDNWFKRDLNNARLVAVATYRRWVPAFYAMYKEVGEDLPAFHVLAEEIGSLPSEERQSKLAGYLDYR